MGVFNMIKFLKMKESDVKDVVGFLNENDIYEEEIEKQFPFTFIIKRDECILGLGYFGFIGNKSVIKNIFVQEDYRNMGLGESLLRTILNFLYISGTKDTYYFEKNNIYNYLCKIGFTEHKERGLYMDIEKFFLQPCKGSK